MSLVRAVKAIFDNKLTTWTCEHVPTTDVKHHTAFTFFQESGSNRVVVMPEGNFLLCSKGTQDNFRKFFTEKGYELILSSAN